MAPNADHYCISMGMFFVFLNRIYGHKNLIILVLNLFVFYFSLNPGASNNTFFVCFFLSSLFPLTILNTYPFNVNTSRSKMMKHVCFFAHKQSFNAEGDNNYRVTSHGRCFFFLKQFSCLKKKLKLCLNKLHVLLNCSSVTVRFVKCLMF